MKVANLKDRNVQIEIKREFNKHGVLVSEGKLFNGLQHGVWREYYDSGELAIMQSYVNGIPHGRFTSFHMNGNTWSEGVHSQGRCEGTFQVYDEAGAVVRIMIFKEGALVEEKDISPKQEPVYVDKK